MSASKVLSLCLLTAWAAVQGAPARADFSDGLAAYDGGDYATAFAEWRPLAEAGQVEAQVALANLYMNGEGIAADTAAALLWYRRAAEAGNPVAQLNLGDFYARGLGVARDPVEAYVWLSLAAVQGRAWAARRRAAVAGGMSPAQLREAEARLQARRP